MKVCAWYGLTGEINVENEFWHLVKVGNVTLNHPPLVNRILRRGLPRDDRLRLSYLHEFGHFQTLPFALLHLLFLLKSTPGRRRSLSGWLAWLAALFLAHETVWELAAEAYVIMHDGKAYLATYRKTPNPLLPAFSLGVSSLGIGLSWRLLGSRPSTRRPGIQAHSAAHFQAPQSNSSGERRSFAAILISKVASSLLIPW